MAHIFVGNRAMVDDEVLDAVRALNDEFWVFAEFDVNRRNIDWLIIRQVPDDRPPGRYSTVILTELKRTRAVLDGEDNGRWREMREGIWHEMEPGNMRDMNPWRQLINTVNTFREWLYNNQRRFLSGMDGQVYPEAAVKVWPNLLILSDPPDTVHRLPLKPHNGFGAYHFHLGEWARRAWGWTPRDGLQLTAGELADLARVLGVQALPHEPSRAIRESFSATPLPSTDDDDDMLMPSLDWLEGFATWASDLEQRVQRLERQFAQRSEDQTTITTLSKKTPEPLDTPSRSNARPSDGATPPSVDRPLTEDERQLISTALATLKELGKNRDFPCLFSEMHRIVGGPTFKSRNFNGFGSAMSMMNRAVEDGLVVYGPPDANGIPTVYFPDEMIPDSAPDRGRDNVAEPV
jgi:hypothetical protein